ncbi:MAG: amino acid permease, partial [Clostridiaceae bacterium]|nr:amino acid permease [Clostridiaceae bacterium]
ANIYHPVPGEITVIAQIATQVFGSGSIMFYSVQVITALLLIMAANTAYADFPFLLSIISKDGFAPRQFTKRGKRLSFSNGIILLCTGAIVLIIIFQADTHFLLPLYAVGVFLSFTLSQSGMFMRWLKLKTPGWRHKAFINGLGATVTFMTVIILIIEKFEHGAWIVCIIIPILVFVMTRIKRHYSKVAEQLKLTVAEKPKDISFIKQKQYVIVPIDTLNRSFLKALNYARTISDNVIVFHIAVDEESSKKLQAKWEEYDVGIPMVVKKSPYRDVLHVLCNYIDSEEYAAGPNDTVTVVLPQFVITKWWHAVLHNQTSVFIRSMLMRRRNIAVITVPYIIEE